MTRLFRALVAFLGLLAAPALAQSHTGSQTIADLSKLQVTAPRVTDGVSAAQTLTARFTDVRGWIASPSLPVNTPLCQDGTTAPGCAGWVYDGTSLVASKPISGDVGPSTVTATGSTTARALKDRWAEVVRAADFGAKTDGTDASAAIQAAINYAVSSGIKKVVLPSGTLTVNSSLNLQGIQGLQIIGAGAGATTPSGQITRLNAKMTGRPTFDCVGANMLTFRDFIVWGDQTLTPSAAFLFSRNSANSGAGMHDLSQVWTNGWFTKAAVVSLSSEVNRYRGCSFQNTQANAHAFWTDSGNLAVGMVSDFVNPPDVQSGGNTMFLFDGTQFNVFGGGTSASVKGSFTNATWLGCYSNSNGYATFDFGAVTNSAIVGHRDESSSTYGMSFTVNSSNLSITGSKFGRGVYGANGVVIERLTIQSTELAWVTTPDPPGPWVVNVDQLKYSFIDSQNNIKVRTLAYGNQFPGAGEGMISGAQLSLPTDSRSNSYSVERTMTGYSSPVIEWHLADGSANSQVVTQRFQAAKFVDKVQQFTASAGGSITTDTTLGSVVVVTLQQASTTMAAPGYGPYAGDAGARLTYIFHQDATGSRVVTWNATYMDPGTFVPTAAANAVSAITFIADPVANKWVAVSWRN